MTGPEFHNWLFKGLAGPPCNILYIRIPIRSLWIWAADKMHVHTLLHCKPMIIALGSYVHLTLLFETAVFVTSTICMDIQMTCTG